MERTHVAVQLEDLVDAFEKGLVKFLDDLERNPTPAQRAHTRAERFFTDMDNDYAEGMLQFVVECSPFRLLTVGT